MNGNIFDKLDFGPLRALLDNDDITDISFDNNGQIWIRSLTQGSLRVEVKGATPEFVEKLAFQCSNVMGTTFNNAKPFLDAESSELRLNFVHPSIATNGIAMVIRKTPAKIRLQKEKLLDEDYFTQDIHDILIKCVEGHCNIIVAGETGSGKTEFVKYLASHTKTSEKIITIEDTLELHLDKIFPQRDIVAMKTNNVASYTDVLVTCMRQNPKWILLSEVRSAEAVTAVRNSISSGHNILSTIHADKASAIPYRLYSLMETDIDVNQFLSTIYRYIQLGVHIRAYYSKERGKFHREVDEVVEFYVDENNQPQSRIIYQKVFGKEPILRKPSKHLIEYLENQNIDITSVTEHMVDDIPFQEDADFDESEVEYSEEAAENEYQEDTEYEEQAEESVSEEYYEEQDPKNTVAYEVTEEAEENNDEQEVQFVAADETDDSEEAPVAIAIEESNETGTEKVPLAGLTQEVQVALTAENEPIKTFANAVLPNQSEVVKETPITQPIATQANTNVVATPLIPKIPEQQVVQPSVPQPPQQILQNVQQPVQQSPPVIPVQQQVAIPQQMPQPQVVQNINQPAQITAQMPQTMQPMSPQQVIVPQGGMTTITPQPNGIPPVGSV